LLWEEVWFYPGRARSGNIEAYFGCSLGYSYLTNQHGLGFDNVVSFELVLPNGTVTDISDSTNPDLFFALRVSFQRSDQVDYFNALRNFKGGFNNYVCSAS
jgi:hypothetical protein